MRRKSSYGKDRISSFLRGGLKRRTKRLFGNQPAAVLQSKRDAAY